MMLFSTQGSAATSDNYVVETTGDPVKLCSLIHQRVTFAQAEAYPGFGA